MFGGGGQVEPYLLVINNFFFFLSKFIVTRFSSTSSIVQINLGSLEASIIEFSSSLEIAPEK